MRFDHHLGQRATQSRCQHLKSVRGPRQRPIAPDSVDEEAGGDQPVGSEGQCGEPSQIFIGYVVGAAAMTLGGIIQATMVVEAAGRDLEDIAPPLSATEEELAEPG
jgi:hypothetical protein